MSPLSEMTPPDSGKEREQERETEGEDAGTGGFCRHSITVQETHGI